MPARPYVANGLRSTVCLLRLAEIGGAHFALLFHNHGTAARENSYPFCTVAARLVIRDIMLAICPLRSSNDRRLQILIVCCADKSAALNIIMQMLRPQEEVVLLSGIRIHCASGKRLMVGTGFCRVAPNGLQMPNDLIAAVIANIICLCVRVLMGSTISLYVLKHNLFI